MGPMHLFRTVLVALSSTKTFGSGLFMRPWQQQQQGDGSAGSSGTAAAAAAPPDGAAWRRRHEVVFVDSSGWLNLAAGVSKAALAQARACASHSLALLNGGTPEAFEAVFLAPNSLAGLWDYWYHVQLPEEAEQQQQEGRQAAAALQSDQPSWRCGEGGLGRLLPIVAVMRGPVPLWPCQMVLCSD